MKIPRTDWLNLAESVYYCGYLGIDDIHFECSRPEFFIENKNQIDNFIDYLLNEPGCSDRIFKTNIIPIQSNIKEEQSIFSRRDLLAFSGGIDSLTSYFLMDNPICVFADYQQPQLKQEDEAVQHYGCYLNIDVELYKVIRKPDVGFGWPLNGFKIPARNFLMMSTLTGFIKGDSNLGLGVYKGEMIDKNRDKSKRFFAELTDLFSKYYDAQIKVYSPIENMTKSEEINFLIQNYVDITDSRTCVSSEDEPCGKCKPCFNLWVSLKNSNYSHLIKPEWEEKIKNSGLIDWYRVHLDEYDTDRKSELLKAIE